MGEMFPRTVWVHAVRAWLDGEIGPDGEQLTLPGMPEPPEAAAQRMWFLVVADYARPDGHLYAAREDVQRRWHISPKTATRYWRDMRRAGWVRLTGNAHPGKAQPRQLTIPAWAVEILTGDGDEGQPVTVYDTPAGVTIQARMGTHQRVPITRMGTHQRANGYPPASTPEVVRSESSQVTAHAPRALWSAPTDLTDRTTTSNGPQPAAVTLTEALDPARDEEAEWLAQAAQQLGVELAPTTRTRGIARAAIGRGWLPRHLPAALEGAGHNLALMRSGAIVVALTDLTGKDPTGMYKAPEPWRANLPAECPHPNPFGLRPNQCRACRVAAGEPQEQPA